MSLIVRNDEQITVGVTPGLVAGSSSFTFDGTGSPATPDYRLAIITIRDISAPNLPMTFGLDYQWNPLTGFFQFTAVGVKFQAGQVFKVTFQPLAHDLGDYHYSFINSSFFVRDINLPNVTKQPQVIERLNSFIARYESECLQKILGHELYQRVLTEDNATMDALKYGTVWDGKIWAGLVHGDSSPIANYIYYFYQEADAKQTTGTGTKAPNVEAGEQVSPADKMVNAWRYFASETRAMSFYLWNYRINNVRVYPEFAYRNYDYTSNLARYGGVNKYGF